MSWSLILARYPKSILGDELPAIVLAWMERSGLTTEEEISNSIGIEKIKLHNIINDLYKNECVEYGKNWIRVSERGKLLIDRLGISNSIVDDFIGSLNLSELEKEAYEFVLAKYRNEAFGKYLDTSCSIRRWEKLTSQYYNNVNQPKDVESITTGKLALLISDLFSWNAINDFTTKRLDSDCSIKDSTSELAREDLLPEWARLIKVLDFSKAIKAIPFLGAGSSLISQESNKTSKAYHLFVKSLKFKEKENWDELLDDDMESFSNKCFYVYESMRPRIIEDSGNELMLWDFGGEAQKSSSKEIEKKILTTLLKNLKTSIINKLENFEIKQDGYSFTFDWLTKENIAKKDFLTLIWAANSLKDFARASGLTIESAKILINQLDNRCQALLKTNFQDEKTETSSFLP